MRWTARARAGWVALAAAAALAACVPQEPPHADGAALYGQFCAGCHGASGRGDGPAARGLARRPADLSRIAARNGGTYPAVRVMSWIDGFTRAGRHGGQVMPVFDPLLTGPDVLISTGPGVETPTPVQLVALSDYIAGLQRR